MSSASTGSGVEDDAVTFYTQAFTDWGVEEVTFTKLMGKRSQASADVRKVVGKSVKQFASFLMRHTDAFEIRGDHVRRLIDVASDTDSVSKSESRSEAPAESENNAALFVRDIFLKFGRNEVEVKTLYLEKSKASLATYRVLGANVQEFSSFLKRHANLFCVKGEIVTLAQKTVKSGSVDGDTLSGSIECIDYFRKTCLMRSESCIDLRRLAGRRAQASPELRAYLTDIPTTCQFCDHSYRCPAVVNKVIGPGIVRFPFFLCQHPPIFRVSAEDVAFLTARQDPSSYDGTRFHVTPDSESDAVTYFSSKLLQWGEARVFIHRLASTKAQAPEAVIAVVGRKDKQFVRFLERHHEVFKVKGRFVSLVGPADRVERHRDESSDASVQQLMQVEEDWDLVTTGNVTHAD
ncbi:PREDICTED: uncharacterized protein LOC106814954 [Priapulus caudatus]|uniref:Uncharacterized protein LOC106814954 n=1 Tax=Priapulus caudatus TaxID=37621 RepID=A0ABM1ERL2_PRICU|nr:PREDICTED: uncharacterized protein LOC106814954 [Priapulus caudatus]